MDEKRCAINRYFQVARVYMLGMAVKMANLHRRYQANSVKDKAVLSYQFIGLRAFKDKQLKLEKKDWTLAFEKIQ